MNKSNTATGAKPKPLSEKLVDYAASLRLTLILLALLASGAAAGTLVQQGLDGSSGAQRYGSFLNTIFLHTSMYHVFSSRWFRALMCLLAVNTVACTSKRISFKLNRLGWILTHVSLILILAGRLVGGYFGKEGLVPIREEQGQDRYFASQSGGEGKGEKGRFGFEVFLHDFSVEYTEEPVEKLVMYDVVSKRERSFPVHENAEFVYRSTGHKLHVKIEDKTDAQTIRVTFEGEGGPFERLIIAGAPHGTSIIPGKVLAIFTKDYPPSQYKSAVEVREDGRTVLSTTIEMNATLKHNGWRFYQMDYDHENESYTVLRVRKDPGIGIVYAGFALLCIGVIFLFYVNPYLDRRRTQ